MGLALLGTPLSPNAFPLPSDPPGPVGVGGVITRLGRFPTGTPSGITRGSDEERIRGAVNSRRRRVRCGARSGIALGRKAEDADLLRLWPRRELEDEEVRMKRLIGAESEGEGGLIGDRGDFRGASLR